MTTKAHAAAGRKSDDKYRAPHPGSSRVPVQPNTRSAALAVYDGRERLGSYRLVADRWIAVDRLNRPIGQFDTAIEAADAISAAARGGQ